MGVKITFKVLASYPVCHYSHPLIHVKLGKEFIMKHQQV